jgi:outer membrane beta-barrel protein
LARFALARLPLVWCLLAAARLTIDAALEKRIRSRTVTRVTHRHGLVPVLGIALLQGAALALVVPAAARAAEPAGSAGARDDAPRAGPAKARRPSDEPPPPSCLDQSITDELGESLRPRGVQKRPFLKDGRFELVARGGLYASDLLSSSYQYGGALAWWLGEDFGFELSFDVSPVAVDLDKPLSDFFGDPRFRTEMGYLALGHLLWSPIHFKAKTSGGGLIHGDAAFVVGAGKLFHDTAQGAAFDGGLLVELYLARWLSLRFDLRDVVLVQEAIGETRVTHNLTGTLGLGLWVPFWFL